MRLSTVWRVTDLIERREICSCGVPRAPTANHSELRVKPHSPRRCVWRSRLTVGCYQSRDPRQRQDLYRRPHDK